MLSNEIIDKVLFIGMDYLHSRGGVPQCERNVKEMYRHINFIPTSVDGRKWRKLLCGIKGMARFAWTMTWNKNIKIVHINGCTGMSFWRKRFFAGMAKLWGKKVAYQIHSGDFPEFREMHNAPVDKFLKDCDLVIALSEYWQRYFQEECGCQNVCIVSNPIQMPAHSHAKGKGNDQMLNALFLGQLTPQKGLFDLIEALSEGRQFFQGRLHVTIGGAGDAESLLEAIKSEGLVDIVEYKGWIGGDDKAAAFENADVFVLPSHFEAFPMSILEAMSYGIPVLATNVGGIPDMVKDGVNGILVPPKDSLSLGAALRSCLALGAELNAMGANACAQAMRYSFDNIRSQMEAAYASLLTSKE